MNEGETVHWTRPFIFNAVTAVDVFSFSLFVQIGSGGHTNSHDHPHFCWDCGGTFRTSGFLPASTVHPALWTDSCQPVLDGRDAPEIFLHVLFSEVADRHLSTVRVPDGDTGNSFGQKDSFGVMTKGAVAEVGEERFGFVKPPVDCEIASSVPPNLRVLFCACSTGCAMVKSHR